MQIIKKVLFLFTPKEKFKASVLLVMILIMASLDMIGVASILPFMAIITNPSLIEINIILKNVFQFSKTFGIENYQQFIFALSFMVFFCLLSHLPLKLLQLSFRQEINK